MFLAIKQGKVGNTIGIAVLITWSETEIVFSITFFPHKV